jgi:hypothetical protein
MPLAVGPETAGHPVACHFPVSDQERRIGRVVEPAEVAEPA